jgi:hypothetical protein
MKVNVPKTKKAFCKGCKKHMTMKVTQYKTGKASLFAQGELRAMLDLTARFELVQRELLGIASAGFAAVREIVLIWVMNIESGHHGIVAPAPLQERGDMTASSQATAARPSPSSTRR